MLNQPRLDEIMRLLAQQQRVKASELAQSLYVSEETIRRDLVHLEEMGHLRRIHGGAILPQSNEEPPLQELVSEGMALFLDTGTSTLALAHKLVSFSRLKIITNSLDIAFLLTHQSDNQVLVAPGDVRRNDNALTGPHTLEFARQFHVDVAFMGIGAIDLELGFMDYQEPEALLRRTLVKHCRQSVILADDGKFGHRTFINTLPFDAVTTLITNRAPSVEFAARLENADVDTLYS
jgi:DeoR family glycerol-3-phosphate regulon repressor